jgi:dephospho-CoA kinase
MLIGLTGRNAAGKGEVAEYLKRNGFHYYSLSDVIRDEIRSRGQQPTRETLIQVGNELRQKYGARILAERILGKIEADKDYVIDSIRNPSEVDTLRAAKHFKLIRVEAPVDVRFRRTLMRRRESEPQTLEAFMDVERREEAGDATSQNLIKVASMADDFLVNDGPLEKLYKAIDELLVRL